MPVIDYSSPLEQVQPAVYPKTGTPLPAQTLHLIDVQSGGMRPVALDMRDAYAWVAGWRGEPAEALVIRMTRTGKALELLAVDPRDGSSRRWCATSARKPPSPRWTFPRRVADQVTVLPDGSGFLWFSERDGWRHLYRYGWDGAAPRQLTRGAFAVHRVVRVDSASGQIYVIASADAARPYDQHLYVLAAKAARSAS